MKVYEYCTKTHQWVLISEVTVTVYDTLTVTYYP